MRNPDTPSRRPDGAPHFGISTPVLVQVPGAAAEWEASATVADVDRIAVAADRLGFDYLTCAEHVAVPTEAAPGRGMSYWDPLATLSYLAARTERIRLATSVLVLPYHHPLEIAKRYGTLDRLSGGRVVLGVGVGSLREEFEWLAADWEGRGARTDDSMRALRATLSKSRPEYHGEFYDYGPVTVEPCAVQARIPLWVGGRTKRSLRRAVELGDGWMPFGLRPDALTEMLGAHDLPDGFEVVLATAPLDPIGDPEKTLERVGRLLGAGGTSLTCSIASTSAEHHIEQLAALAELVDPLRGTETR